MTHDHTISHLSAQTLQAFLDGDLSRRDASAAEAHLAACARCAAELDGWRVLYEDLGGLSSHRPHAGFHDRVMAQVDVPESVSLGAGVLGRIEEFTVNAGIGSIVLGFGGRWERDARVSIDIGLGALELRIPEGLGVRLRQDSFLTALDSEGLIKRGDVYESLDYDDADYRIDIDVDAAFGSVSVVWIHPDN